MNNDYKFVVGLVLFIAAAKFVLNLIVDSEMPFFAICILAGLIAIYWYSLKD